MNRIVMVITVVLAGAARADEAALYGQRIVVPDQMSPAVKMLAEDLATHLKQITGTPFDVNATASERGIFLRRGDEADVPDAARKAIPEGSKEAFCLWPDGEKRLWIVGRSGAGMVHGVYAYLEQLGCRWYFPSERWTVVPEKKDIRLHETVARKPAFLSRYFFGSGGFGGGLPLDPKRTLQERWMTWQKRNRFGGEFLLAGHSGEAFNLKHRKELEEHPEYRAEIDGKRVEWSQISKFCAGNKDVVDLYVKDRLDTYRQARKLDPDGPRSWAVSVEPADGGGHCTAKESLALGSVSDRVFHVANQVAKAVRAEFPDGRVSLYAYNEHAVVPNIALEPNVYVMVIPYAFQRTDSSPEQLLDAWSKKVPRMSVYDYWSIPDWSDDLPTFDFLRFGPERLRGWHARKVDGFNCESTFSSGAMGPAWYLGARLAWDPSADERALFDDFVRTSFGPASEPMKRMLTRWSQGFHLTSHELALSYRDLDEAWKQAESRPDVTARVADYGRYVEYLRRRFEYLRADGKTAAKTEAAQRLIEHLWSVYDSSMIHAFRLSQLLTRDEARRGNEALGKRYDWRDPKALGWAGIRPLKDEQVRELVKAGVRDLKPLEFTPRRFHAAPVALKESSSEKVEFSPMLIPSNSLTLSVLATEGNRACTLRVGCEKAIRVTIDDAKGNRVAQQSVETGAKWREEWSEVGLNFPRPGLFRVQLWSPRRTFRLSVPSNVSLSMEGWSNSQGTPTTRLYFWVPKEVDRVAIHADYIPAGPPRFFDPSGKEVKPGLSDGGHMLLLDIPESQRGAVWSLDRAKCALGPLHMLNTPSAFAFFPDALIVPDDALAGRK